MIADLSPNITETSLVKRISVIAFLVIACGGLVLMGWILDIAILKSISPSWVSMKVNTAICFMLIGISLWLTAYPPARLAHQHTVWFNRICLALVAIISTLSLFEYVFGWNLGIDQWLIAESLDTVGTSNPRRMAPETALDFMMLSIALWFIGKTHQSYWFVLLSVTLGLLVTSLALAALLSNLTPVLGHFGWFALTIMAVHTAILFALLGISIIAMSWQPKVLAWVLSRNATIAMVGIMTLLVFIGLSTARSQFWMEESGRQIAHQEALLLNVEEILIEVLDAQSHIRGYGISGSESFKNNYLLAATNSQIKLSKLRDMLASTPQERVLFSQIEGLVNNEFQWLQQAIEIEPSTFSNAIHSQRVAHGEVLMSQLRLTFGQLESEHQLRIVQLKQDAKRVSSFSYLIIFVSTFTSLLVFLMVIFRLNFVLNDRERQAQFLRESEEKFRTLYDSASDAIMLGGEEGYLSFNESAMHMFGCSEQGDFLHKHPSQFSPDTQPNGENSKVLADQYIAQALQTGSCQFEWMHCQLDGSPFAAEVRLTAMVLNGKHLIQATVRDISERYIVSAKIQRLNQLYNLLSRCNQAVIHSTDQEDLFQRICRDAVQIGGMQLAWIGLVDDSGKQVKPVVSFGETKGYLEDIRILLDDNHPLGRGPTATAIRENHPVWCNDFMHCPRTASWHERGAHFGYASSASLPLVKNGVAIGALTLYRNDLNAFDEAVSNLLIEMAADVSYALDNFEHETTRKFLERRTASLLALTTSEEMLDENTLLQRGVDAVQGLTNSRIGFFHFVSEDQNEIELAAWSSDTMAHYCHAVFDQHYPVASAGVWANSIRLKQAVIVNDYTALSPKNGLPEGHASLQRFVSVPILDGSQVRMIVGVGNADHDYGEHDIETIKLFGYDIYHLVQRRRAIKSLETNERHFRAVTQSANDAIITGTDTGSILGWNMAASRMFEYSEAEVIGQPLTMLMPERFRTQHDAALARLKSGAEPHVIGKTVELFGLRKNGIEFPLDLSLSQWHSVEGGFFTAIIRDISERRSMEWRQRENQEIFRHFVEYSPIYVFFKDSNMRALRLSKNFETMLGKPVATLLGKKMDAYFSPEFAESMSVDDISVFSDGSDVTVEAEFEGKTYSVTKFPIFSDGKPCYLAGYLVDITEHKQFEAEQRKAYEQVAGVNAQLLEANLHLKQAQSQLLQSEKMAAIGLLAAGVAHEINNPIGYVNSNLGTLEKYLANIFLALDKYDAALAQWHDDNPLVQELQQFKAKIDLAYIREDTQSLISESHQGLDRVKSIVLDLKDFSHADSQDQWVRGDVHHALESTLNVVWNELKYKCEVVKEYGNLPQIYHLPSQLNQVFMNLLVNAAHAIEVRGIITLRSGQEGDRVWVEVNDTGKGISPEIMPHLFDPFFTTKPVGQGTGLGLSVSYKIIEKHHGSIEVHSEVGKGSTFRVWLPINQPDSKEKT
ncbi:MAG: GAF domain-containing protein [Gallionella sp.]|nr:GAF domain-containing protein [Gallionella sp.]